VAVSEAELGPLPDAVATNPRAGWVNPRAWFPDPRRPLEVEIGSGKGTFLIQHAEEHPDTNFLGIEWAREFFEYAADRIRRRRAGLADEESGPDALAVPRSSALTNVRMLHTDASEFMRWRVPDRAIRVIHLYFSDPWPKTRHHRRRVIQDRFLAEASRALQHHGEIRIVTDHEDLWAWDCAHFADWAEDPDGLLDRAAADRGKPDLDRERAGPNTSQSPRPFVLAPFQRAAGAGDGELVGTNFERKYRREGRLFFAVVLRRS
jgi:tRNA (guanine-N7-)-methyltransferase